ncbi:MAG TPA: DUF3999 family protein [Lacunisphaera sp.]|nr:DUF3999 family protein [Lacunisphaera sp.]
MKNLLPPLPSGLALWPLLAALTAGAAVTPTEWQHRQGLKVTAPGLTRVTLPAAVFDAAQPGLADLRVLDPRGQELPCLLVRDLGDRELAFDQARPFRPESFTAQAGEEATQWLIKTGSTAGLAAIEFETAAPYFLTAAHVDVSADGHEWQSLGAAVPLFRQFGAEQLRLALDRRPAAFIRVTIADHRSRPVVFTGARLIPAPTRAAPPPLAPLGARITRRDEFANETVLTVALDGAHVPLASLTLAATDPLFMRRVTVAIREVQGAWAGERLVGSGTIYRVALDGAPPRAELELPLDFSPPTRELLVHIHNGDSPPLLLAGVSAQQHPVNLVFMAPAAGDYWLLSGNPQAGAPRYDLAAFAGDLRRADAAAVVPGELEAMPDYHPRESLAPAPLPEVPLAGAPLDTRDWPYRRPLRLEAAGVQELELDPEALARTRPDFADVRVMHDGNQIPYVLEEPALARSLTLTATPAPDARRPSVSIWRLSLPHAGLPLRRIVLTSTTPLFERQFRLHEKLADASGGTYDHVLATEEWRRTPEPGTAETKVFNLTERAGSDTLWLETDNGDNPAIALGAVQVVYPVVRLIFKVAETEGFTVAYGNKSASAPRYDLSLVAVKLLTASRHVARIDGAGQAAVRPVFAGLDTGYLFWAALALVVVVLLVIVAKLLPKPPA